jgi:dihydrolipoamide dehydrogenase
VLGVEGGWLFAAGDVTGRTNTTHQGKYDARVAGDVVAHRFGRGAAGAADEPEADDDPGAVGRPQEASDLGSAGSAEVSNELGAAARRDAADDPEAAGDWSRFRATADRAAVPQVVFTRPEVATVGLTEAAARAAGIDVRAVVVPFTSVAGSAFSTQEPGTACLVVDRAREVVVGATFVGPEVAELLHAATVAIVGEVPLARLWHAVPAYPTRSEIWLRLLEAYGL